MAFSRSAGLVVFRLDQGSPRCLLLRAYRLWDFPKGLIESGETPFAAAQRETAEETGLTALRFPWGEVFLETAPYSRGKVARYYLAVATQPTVSLPVNPSLGRPEHHEFRWVACDEAMTLIPPRLEPILSWACAQAGALQQGSHF